MKSELTQKRLKELLNYNADTGCFVWIVSGSGIKYVGSIAGSTSRGYRYIRICNRKYLAHRLAWLYVYGYFPETMIDHRDRNALNNKIKNLREVSNQCNIRNTGNPKNNTSGIKGVCWNNKDMAWRSQLTVNNKNKYLGSYKDFAEAVCARLAGEQCLDWSNCDSSSPAYQYVQKMLKK